MDNICEICGWSKEFCVCRKKTDFYNWYYNRNFFDITSREGIFIIYCLMIGMLMGLLLGVFVVPDAKEAQAVEMTASVEPNICNSNIDILKQCCK